MRCLSPRVRNFSYTSSKEAERELETCIKATGGAIIRQLSLKELKELKEVAGLPRVPPNAAPSVYFGDRGKDVNNPIGVELTNPSECTRCWRDGRCGKCGKADGVGPGRCVPFAGSGKTLFGSMAQYEQTVGKKLQEMDVEEGLPMAINFVDSEWQKMTKRLQEKIIAAEQERGFRRADVLKLSQQCLQLSTSDRPTVSEVRHRLAGIEDLVTRLPGP
ncbi:unnamed protein product [Vitrella brassicaformis CCMP3155]|uniref:Uncharacterized protein n=1 Tax=Vitrella brassicaformis (strain CCMP3155) TaxID=1169540 RepID=A0A0G4H7H8_VITBC|nr:unnamed protein product [Vitrella brassicaformis CCMP3155]|eukprot:CEM39861.1 unnamed protein product [Vitrella brassicaformis CCMP3155]